MPITFDDQVAIVTGAGGGLGKTYALELARRGASVVVNDLGGAPDGTGDGFAADAVVAEIVAAGGRAVASRDSVATTHGARQLVALAVESYGRVDILINNAGILRDRSILKMTSEDFDAVMEVHLKGSFNVTQAAFGLMKEQAYGRILYTTSAAGLFGNFGQVNYSAAKAGLLGLSSVVAIEGAKSGVQSNVIAPLARTRLTEDLLGSDFAAKLDPQAITPMAIYLVSRDCSLTHEIFSAGAGWYGRVAIELGPGWHQGGVTATVEDIAANLAHIRNLEGSIVPLDANDAVGPMLPLLEG